MAEEDKLFGALADGLNEDAKAARKSRGKAKDQPKPESGETSGEETAPLPEGSTALAESGATTGDATESVVSDTSVPAGENDAPAAPGDDAEAVHERRLERLFNIVEDAEFESGTALGDLVDLQIDLFKHRPKVWSAMSADEQRTTVKAIETACKAALKKVVLVIAEEDSLTIQGTMLAQFAVKGDTLEGKLKIEHADLDTLGAVYALAGHKIVIISADDKRFSSKRGEPVITPDQASMSFADAAPKEIVSDKPNVPEDDSDLAGEGDDENAPGGGFVVFFAGDGTWLQADRNSWGDKAEAATFESEEDAALIAAEFEDAEVQPLD